MFIRDLQNLCTQDETLDSKLHWHLISNNVIWICSDTSIYTSSLIHCPGRRVGTISSVLAILLWVSILL